jgi:STE24 endopeptidase
VERAARYHGRLYVAVAARFLLSALLYSLLAWTWIGDRLWDAVDGLGWASAAAGFAAIVLVLVELVSVPLDFWRGFVYERRWGFSTQSARGWASDQAKGLAIAVVLGAGAWTVTVALGRALPSWWWLPAAAAARPARRAPLLRRTGRCWSPSSTASSPSPTSGLADELRALAADAGVPIRDVLVADASKRTTKSNAYVSGLGATRRVVLWDTLLRSAGDREVKLVIAHELGHRRERHAAKLTLLFSVGGGVAVLVLRAVLGTPSPRGLPACAPRLRRPRGRRAASSQCGLTPLRTRRRPLVARPHPRPPGIRGGAPLPRAREPQRPRPAAARIPLPLHASHAARTACVRPEPHT